MNLTSLLAKAPLGIASRARNFCYRAMGVKISGYVWMRSISIPRQWSDICLEDGCALDAGVVLLCSGPSRASKIHIGQNVYINRYTIIDAHQNIRIGKNTMIGPFVYITDGDHGKDAPGKLAERPMEIRPTTIGENVWIGAHSCILRGVNIGDNAVIGAGAVVTRSVGDGNTVAGVPARPLKGQRI